MTADFTFTAASLALINPFLNFIDADLFMLSFSECSWLACGRKHPLWLRIVSFDSVALPLHPMHIATQKASVGMYSGCDYPYKSCLCTFWPCHPYFIFQFYSIVFILVCVIFFIALSVVYQCPLTWFVHSTLNGPSIGDGRCRSSRVRANFVATPLTFLCMTKSIYSWHDKEAAMRLFSLGRKF